MISYLSCSSFKWKASFKSKNVFVHEIGCKSGIEDIWLLGGNNHQMLQKCISKFINNHVIFSHTSRKAISYLKISSQIFWHSNRNCNNLTSKNQYLLLSCIYGKYWYNSLFYLILKFDYMKRFVNIPILALLFKYDLNLNSNWIMIRILRYVHHVMTNTQKIMGSWKISVR